MEQYYNAILFFAVIYLAIRLPQHWEIYPWKQLAQGEAREPRVVQGELEKKVYTCIVGYAYKLGVKGYDTVGN